MSNKIILFKWQGLEGNPSILIGTFVVRHFHGNINKPHIFCFPKLANSKQAWPKCHIHVINYLITYECCVAQH